MNKTNKQARAVLAWFRADHGPQLEASARRAGRAVAVVAAAAVVATVATYRAGALAKAALVAASQRLADAAADPATAAAELAALVAALVAVAYQWATAELQTAPKPAAAPMVAAVPPAVDLLGHRAAQLAALNVANLRSVARSAGVPRSVYRTARRAELLTLLVEA